MILEWAEGISRRIRGCVGESAGVRLANKQTRRERDGFWGVSERKRGRRSGFRRTVMKKWEESLIGRAFGRIFEGILRCGADAIGLFLLTLGSVMLAATVTEERGLSFSSLFLPIAILFCSVPLLGARRSPASLRPKR